MGSNTRRALCGGGVWLVGCLWAGCGGGGTAGGMDMACSGAACTQGTTCTLTDNTTQTAMTSTSGCALLQRDTSSCMAARQAAGLSGYWLKFSCRVTLTVTTQAGASYVQAQADGQPDYKSNYFA